MITNTSSNSMKCTTTNIFGQIKFPIRTNICENQYKYFATYTSSQDMTATSTSQVTTQGGNDLSGNSIIVMISPPPGWLASCEGDNWVYQEGSQLLIERQIEIQIQIWIQTQIQIQIQIWTLIWMQIQIQIRIQIQLQIQFSRNAGITLLLL